MRLDKYLCKSTLLSRDEAIVKIRAGSVTINGSVVTDGSAQIHKNNTAKLDGKTLCPRDFRYIVLHKPLNTVCSNRDEAYPSVFNYLTINNTHELHIVGRLDADTTGLVLITDDGHWSFNITRPEKKVVKTYRVGLKRPINDDVTAKFAEGVMLQGEHKATLPASLVAISPTEVLLTITEGRFHQIKRMFATVGNRVISLHRQQIGTISLDVDIGKWRYLTESEINSLTN